MHTQEHAPDRGKTITVMDIDRACPFVFLQRMTDRDDQRREMDAIAAHLERLTGVTDAERAYQTARRKEIYEALHPETVAHVAGAHAANRKMGNASAKLAPAFTKSTATATGKSERAVQSDARRGEKLADVLPRIKGTSLDASGRGSEVRP